MTDFLQRVYDHLAPEPYPFFAVRWEEDIQGADLSVWNDAVANQAFLVCDEQPGSHTTGLIALLHASMTDWQAMLTGFETRGFGVLVIPTTQADRLTEQMIREAQAAEIQIWGFDGTQLTVLFE